MSRIDECKMGKYKVKLHLEKEEKEFDDIDDVYIYIYEKTKCREKKMYGFDKEQEHGVIANTNLYEVIKGYRDTPDCYLF